MTLILAKSRFGRMVLHLICLAHDGKWRWHWAGIWREFHSAGITSTEVRSPAELATLDTM